MKTFFVAVCDHELKNKMHLYKTDATTKADAFNDWACFYNSQISNSDDHIDTIRILTPAASDSEQIIQEQIKKIHNISIKIKSLEELYGRSETR